MSSDIERWNALSPEQAKQNGKEWSEHLRWLFDHANTYGIKLKVEFKTPDGMSSKWSTPTAAERQRRAERAFEDLPEPGAEG